MAFDNVDSDSSYDDEGPPLDNITASSANMNLRNTARLKRPVRYRDDLEPIDPGRPAFVHQDPVFDMDRAKFVQWPSLELDEPSPGEAQYRLWQEQGEPRDAFGQPIKPSHAQAQVAESPGPTVAHLRRQSIPARSDMTQPVVDSIEQRDEFDEAFERNLAEFEDSDEPRSGDDDESLVIHPPLSAEFQDWSALKDNVKWAVIYDLSNDHQDGITAAANLLGLTLPDVIEFVNVYVRDKTLWENGVYQDVIVQPASTLFQRDKTLWENGVYQDVIVQPASTLFQREQTDFNPPTPDGIDDIWNEPEVELFLEPELEKTSPAEGTQLVAEAEAGQSSAEITTAQPSIQKNDEPSDPIAWPPVVELITDSFSREDIASGRSFLTFMGLKEYADRFGQWFGTGFTFREIPGIFDENNNFVFSADVLKKKLYCGNEFEWQGPVPQLQKGDPQRESLMEALPQNPVQQKWPAHHPRPQTIAGYVNSRPIKLCGKNEEFLDYLPEGEYGGLRYGEPAPTGALAEILADHEFDEEEVETLMRKEPHSDNGSQVDRRNNNNFQGIGDNLELQGTLGDFGDEGARLFNTSSTMQLCPYMPRFDNGIAPRILEMGHIDINAGDNTRRGVPPPYLSPLPQLPPFLHPHQGIARPSNKAVHASGPLGHNSSHVASSDQALQARARDSSSTTPKPTASQSTEAPSNLNTRMSAEKDTRDARATVEVASGEATDNAGKADAQGTADSGRFAENGIEVATFSKCYSCFQARARCDGGRPCSSCLRRNRKCKDVTKADLDKMPDRAERVVKDKARADRIAAQAEGRNVVRATPSTPDTVVPAAVVSYTATSGPKRKQSALAGNTSTDEDDSELDTFPPEQEDPDDSDYESAPKKKQPKQGNTAAGKKQPASQTKLAAPATSTPPKRRGPYRKKGDTSTSTQQPGGSAHAGKAVTATSARKASANAPAAVQDKLSGEGSVVGAGAGRSVNDAAKVVRHAGGQSGMTNVQPGPVRKRGETPKLAEKSSLLDSSLFPSNPSFGARDSRYLDIPFAPVIPRTHTPTGRFVPAMQMTQMARPIAGSPDNAVRAAPFQGAYPVPLARDHLIPPRPRTISAGNDHLSGTELPRTAFDLTTKSLGTPMALQEMLPMTTDRMLLAPQIARPGLHGSPGAIGTSPTSQSSNSTVSMDFSRIPSSAGQESPTRRQGSVSGRLRQSSSDTQGMSGFSPSFSAGSVTAGSPTPIASQRRRLVSSHNNGTRRSGNGIPSPMMEADPAFTMAYGPLSPYGMVQHQRPTPHPIARMQQGPGYPIPQQWMHPYRSPGVVHGPQSEMQPGSRGLSASPARKQANTTPTCPAKRQTDATLNPGQQPARKKLKVPASPLPPPRGANSWKELAHNSWANDTQDNQPELASSSAKPVFGGDGSYDVSFSQFTRIHEQIDPELQQTAMEAARKMNKLSVSTSENH